MLCAQEFRSWNSTWFLIKFVMGKTFWKLFPSIMSCRGSLEAWKLCGNPCHKETAL